MALEQQRRLAIGRAVMAMLGALAGLALWLFVEVLPERIDNLRLLLFCAALVMGGFAVLLALSGPVRPERAALGALGLALPAAILPFWASFRFEGAEAFLAAGHGTLAYAIFLFIGAPFVAAALQSPGGWRDYARLFDISWTIVVRYVAGGLFVGLVWAVVALSNELLQLVGVDLIERLLDIEAVPYGLSGLALGLALAVVHELRDYVSPFLIHRLMRLLLPALLVVVAIFILALPLRGLSGLFGSFSAAGVLMAVSFAGITLISTALDRGDDEAVHGALMIWAARALSLLLPVLAGLAIYAVWLRVNQYGWTPQRLMAAAGAHFLLGYGLAYAVAALRPGRGWMGWVREANRWMAMALIGVAALWMTPLLNAERISAASQTARALEALERPDRMALWEMAHEWGHAGQAALARLEQAAQAAGEGAVVQAAERARAARSRYAYTRQMDAGDLSGQVAALAALLPVRPDEAALPEGALRGFSAHHLRLVTQACENRLPDGRPGCVAVLGDFRPGLSGPSGFVLLNRREGFVQVLGLVLRDGRLEVSGGAKQLALSAPGGNRARSSPETIARVLDGGFEIVPARLKALRIGDLEIIPDN